MEVLALAARRLTELSGDSVFPDELAIGKSTQALLPKLQQRYATLGEKLSGLNLPGEETIKFISKEILNLLETDASEAPIIFGSEQSKLYKDLIWAQKLKLAFEDNLDKTIETLRNFEKEIAKLPSTGTLGNLKNSVSNELIEVSEKMNNHNFFEDVVKLQTLQTSIEGKITETVSVMEQEQKERLNATEIEFGRIPAWHSITAEERQNALTEIQRHATEPTSDINGLRDLNNAQTDITNTFDDIKKRIIAESAKNPTPIIVTGKPLKSIKVPLRITSGAELEALVAELTAAKVDLDQYELEITIR